MFQKKNVIAVTLLILLINGLFLSITAYASNSIQPLEKVHLQLKWFHQFQFAGYYAAIEQGYYAEEGLEVDIRERNLEKSVTDQVVSGESEYGVGDSGLLHEYALGKPIVALAAIFQHNPLVFITKQSSRIISPFEMKGKRIMLDSFNANEAPLKALLTSANITYNDITIVKQSNDNSLLTRGDLDVMTGYLTDQPFYYKQNNIPINIINPQNYGVDFYGDILFTSENERQKHSERIDRFVRATLKGWEFAIEHPQLIIDIIIKKYHSKLSLPHLLYEAEETFKLIPKSVPLGYIDLDRLAVLTDSYAKANYNQAIDTEKLNNFVYKSVIQDLTLTESELQWLNAHPTIRVGVNPNKQPYDWVNDKQEFVGMAADYLKLLEQKLGIHFTIIYSKSMSETIELAKQGRIDMIAGIVITKERTEYLNFLKPYIDSPNVIIDNGKINFIDNINNLSGKVVAVEKSYAIYEWLKHDHPEINLLEASDASSALKLLNQGKADAYIGDAGGANYWIKKEELFDLRFSGQTEYRSKRSIAITKKQPELFSIMHKASASIDSHKIDDIVNHWLSAQIDQGISKTFVYKYGTFIIILLIVFSGWIVRLNREIKAKRLIEQREVRRNTVLDMLTTSQPLSKILFTISNNIDQMDKEIACTIVLLSDDQKLLQHGAAPRLLKKYNQTIDGIDLAPNNQARRNFTFIDKSIFVKDIHSNPYWDFLKESTQYVPYNSCWSQPIFSKSKQLLGLFLVYTNELNSLNNKTLQLLTESSDLVSFAIEKSKIDKKLQMASDVFNYANEGIYITDREGNILDCNDRFLDICGYTRKELIGQNPRIFKSGVHDEEFYQHMLSSLSNNGFWSGEVWNKYKNRDISPGLHSISVIKNDNPNEKQFLVLTTDISALKQHQQLLERFAYYDILTGLPNRQLILDRLEQEIKKHARHNKSLAVLFIDLDGFKTVNDNYGHTMGDEFLIAVSQQMKKSIRDSDTLGRLGGDEFVAVLNDLDSPKDLDLPLSKLLKASSTPITLRGLELKVSASIGVRFYNNNDDNLPLLSANILIRQADQAMYVAKQSGKNNYYLFDNYGDTQINTRREIIDQIQNGIRKNEFLLYFQPKVNMRTGEIVGVEALIRWNHPAKGILLPDSFLPIIENHPLSIELGEWVLNNALEQLHDWQTQRLNIPISVNIDARQLHQNSFFIRLQYLLSRYPNFNLGFLELEILETTAITDRNHANKLILDCAKVGVKFSLDDFGTGYSSITYLKQLPVNAVKIDRSFIGDIDKNPKDLEVLKSIIALALTLEKEVIAEGVESIAQGEILLNMGCELAQGFIIAHPMPASEIQAWIQNWQPPIQWLNFANKSN